VLAEQEVNVKKTEQPDICISPRLQQDKRDRLTQRFILRFPPVLEQSWPKSAFFSL
jgi:hypothetical protein